MKSGPRATWFWINGYKCRFLGPTQIEWTRISGGRNKALAFEQLQRFLLLALMFPSTRRWGCLPLTSTYLCFCMWRSAAHTAYHPSPLPLGLNGGKSLSFYKELPISAIIYLQFWRHLVHPSVSRTSFRWCSSWQSSRLRRLPVCGTRRI